MHILTTSIGSKSLSRLSALHQTVHRASLLSTAPSHELALFYQRFKLKPNLMLAALRIEHLVPRGIVAPTILFRGEILVRLFD